MEETEIQFCQGCLSRDRKSKVLDDDSKKQCFVQIILEISSPIDENHILLCWECEAVLRRFIKFKSQAQKCYEKLQNQAKKYIKPENSSITTQKQYNINLIPTEDTFQEFEQNYKVIKLESNDICTEVKTEYVDDIYSDNNSDDDKTLIELCVKEKERAVKKRRRKKEKPSPTPTALKPYKEIELTEQEIEKERRETERAEDYVNAAFRCERCVVTFANGDDCSDHVRVKHDLNASKFKCKICECSFASEVSYNYHINRHTKRFECNICGARYRSERGAGRHYDVDHCRINNDLELTNSMNGLKSDPELDNGIKPESSTYPCTLCDKSFRWKTSLRKHLETHSIETGQKRRPYCEICSLAFSTTCNLQKHVKTSSKHQIQLKLRKLKETQAENPENNEVRIEEIKSSIINVRQMYPCGQCDKKFQWRGNLLRHLHSHAARANGSLVCEPCNRSFSSIATYQQHMKISRKHVSETDFKYMCSECGKRFANKTRLRDHVNWEHLKNFVHKCSVCQKVFKSHTSLYLHKQVVHKKDDAEHLCDHCGKPFPNRAKLRCHIIALHTSDAPYACVSCNARFSWHSCLSRHVRRVHKQERDAQRTNDGIGE